MPLRTPFVPRRSRPVSSCPQFSKKFPGYTSDNLAEKGVHGTLLPYLDQYGTMFSLARPPAPLPGHSLTSVACPFAAYEFSKKFRSWSPWIELPDAPSVTFVCVPDHAFATPRSGLHV